MKEYIIKVDENKKDIMGNCLLVEKQQELVRCKDCKYGDLTKNMRNEDMIFCYNGYTGIEDGYLHEPDWFCSEGIIKDVICQ